MAKKWAELVAKMNPERRARVQARAQDMLENLALDELREARDLTQAHLASLLHVNQSAISKLERRADMYVSTLQAFVEAMGGQLEIRAVFPDGVVRISRLKELARRDG